MTKDEKGRRTTVVRGVLVALLLIAAVAGGCSNPAETPAGKDAVVEDKGGAGDDLTVAEVAELVPEPLDVAEVAPDGGQGEIIEEMETVDIPGEIDPALVLDIEIHSPDEGEVLNIGTPALFEALVRDGHGGGVPSSVIWESDKDGVLFEESTEDDGHTVFETTMLSAGEHVVTLTATGPGGEIGEAKVTVYINSPPVTPPVLLTPESPATGDDLTAVLDGEPSDPDDDVVTLKISWFKNGQPMNSFDDKMTVGYIATTLGDTWSVVVKSHDGHMYGNVSQEKVDVLNGLPSLESAVITPAQAYTDTPLTCTGDGWSDPDNAEPAWTYAWSVAGAVAEGQTDSVLLPEHFAKSNPVVCTLTPFDDWGSGEPVDSEPVVILNSAPVGGEALLEPGTGDNSTLFTCFPAGSTDVDGDEVHYLISWYSNGQLVDGAEGATLDGAALKKGDALYCRVVPTDLQAEGATFDSNFATVTNSPPTIGSVALGPDGANGATDLECSAAAIQDPDGDEVETAYAWTVNGESVEGEDESTLPAEHIGKDDEVSCTVTPYDGEVWGEGVTPEEPLVILNALPTFESAQLTPEEGDELSLFACAAQGWSDPDGDLFEATYSWEVNGETVEEAETGVLSGLHYDKGDEVVCYAYPKNGDDLGQPVKSNVGTVVNAPPYVQAAKVEPPAGPLTTIFECTFSGLGDPDPADQPYVEFLWYADGELVDGETADTLSAVTVGKNISLQCEVTPMDGTASGTPVKSETALVVNTAPFILSVAVEPAQPNLSTEVFQCVPFGWQDLDGDPPSYLFKWFMGGIELPGETEETLTGLVLTPELEISCEATPRDDLGQGMPVLSQPVVVMNHAPAVESLTLGPEPANTLTELECSPQGWLDVDGDPEQYIFLWFVNSQQLGGQSASTLSGDNFGTGDEVACRVIPFDGHALGDEVESNTVTIDNTPPAAQAAVLAPPEGSVLTEFACEVSGWIDPDDDPETYDFQWFVNDAELADYSKDKLAAPLFVRDDVIYCRATPNDGLAAGEAVESTPVTVDNAPPEAAEAVIVPNEVFTATTLECQPSGWFDADGDAEDYVYAWTVDEVLLEGEDGPSLDGGNIAKNQVVACTVVPHDGIDGGSEIVSAPVTVKNSPPVLGETSVTPESAGHLETFTCIAGDATDADDDEVVFEYQWALDGIPVEGATAATFVPEGSEPGAVLTCTATPFDSEEYGAAVPSGEATVVNHAPEISGAAVAPAQAWTDTELSCVPEGWSDEDGHQEGYKYKWFVDGGELDGQTDSTLPGEHFSKHQSVHCVATPFDSYDEGEEVTAGAIEILNSPPALAAAQLDPAEGTSGNTFTCMTAQTSDADTDPVTVNFQWLLEGEVVVGPSDETWQPDVGSAGQALACRVTPEDDEETGAAVTSDPVVLGNTAPTVDSVAISPEEPATTTELSCSATGEDDFEGDPVGLTYAWLVDGLEVDGQTESTLAGDHFAKHQQVVCRITPHDLLDDGTPVDSPATTIVNTPPTAPAVSVSPAAPVTSDQLTCHLDAQSEDADGDEVTYGYRWYLDDALQEAQSAATVSADDTKECQNWRCEAIPNDQETDGAADDGAAEIAAGDEVCDAHDNNCDGDVDEGFNVLVLPCDGLQSVTRRVPITVSGSASWQLTAFEVRITVPHQTNMQPDFRDVRFTDQDGQTLLDHWLESHISSTSAVFWVKVPTIPAQPGQTTLYMYYGNPLADSLSDIHDTFLFGDDFEDEDWTAENWTSVLGSWAVVDGVFQGTGDDAVVRSSQIISEESRVMEGRMRTTAAGPEHPWDMGWMHIKYKDESNDVYALAYQAGSGFSTGDVGVSVEYQGGFTGYDTSSQATPALNPASWNDYRIQVNGVNAKLWVNGQFYIDADNSLIANIVASYIGLAAHDCTTEFDSIRVRKYAPAAPPTALGPVEEICVPTCLE